jgi:uncharacterized protein (DUF1778 family)
MTQKSKSKPFNIRLPEEAREVIVAAAQREDRSLANFMIHAAIAAAQAKSEHSEAD